MVNCHCFYAKLPTEHLIRLQEKEMNLMSRCCVVAAFLVLAAWSPVFATAPKDVLSQIELMAEQRESAEDSLGESVVAGIAADPSTVSKALIPKLNDKTLKEQRLAVYVWALGLTRDEEAISPIEALLKQTSSALIKANCLRAVGEIGGPKAEEILLSAFDASQDKNERFEILNLLAQLQCEAMLPKTEDILKEDVNTLGWQSVFLFGKMGDKAVPFLLKRINDTDRNVRANAITVLGQWLMAPEALKPLQEQFWIEKDLEVRHMIMSSLERIIGDFDQMKTFFGQVENKEEEGELIRFALETLRGIDALKADLEARSKKKKSSASSFQSEYDKLFKSAGKEGDYNILDLSSTAQDEPKLKALRERILQRNSDEAFGDYQKVNAIIVRNRMMPMTTDEKNVQR